MHPDIREWMAPKVKKENREKLAKEPEEDQADEELMDCQVLFDYQFITLFEASNNFSLQTGLRGDRGEPGEGGLPGLYGLKVKDSIRL